MKKLVVCAAAAVLGLAASAATVDWQYKITGAQGTEGYNNGYTVYLVDAAAWDTATISADTFTDSSVVLDSTTFGAAVGRTVGQKTYTTIGNASGQRSKVINSLAEDASYDVYYVILNTNTDPDSYTTIADTLTGRSDTGEARLGSNTSMTAADASSATWTTVGGGSSGGGGGGTEGGAPEPTSGLLLLVGGAMLALRRKQK